jgi:hypothetical protein
MSVDISTLTLPVSFGIYVVKNGVPELPPTIEDFTAIAQHDGLITRKQYPHFIKKKKSSYATS